MVFAVKLHIEVSGLKRILSAVLVLSLFFSFSACSEKNIQPDAPAEVSETSFRASDFKNESVKTLVGDGRLNTHIDYDLPTTLGLLRNISEEAKYETVIYDELPAKVRNVSKYLLGNILMKVESYIAQTGDYIFVRFFNTSYGDTVYIILDDSNRVYRVFMFKAGEKKYTLMQGGYMDFSSSYMINNKKYLESAVLTMTMDERTNDTLFCRYSFPMSDTETVEVMHDESGDMLYCRDKTNTNEIIFGNNLKEISVEKCNELIRIFSERINKKYGIEIIK